MYIYACIYTCTYIYIYIYIHIYLLFVAAPRLFCAATTLWRQQREQLVLLHNIVAGCCSVLQWQRERAVAVCCSMLQLTRKKAVGSRE